jgi:pimeloyl-ACP methyl ester carboxylesterase
MTRRWLAILPFLWFACTSWADGPGDNLPDKVRPVPPAGIKLSAAQRQELQAEINALGEDIAALRGQWQKKPALLELLPDVQIYYNAAHYALAYNEFFRTGEIDIAHKLLQQGRRRAQLLREGQAPWTSSSGLVVRGYVSRIDGSVQPYGLVVPPSFHPGTPYRHRLDIWFHGRGETLSEVNFLNDRQTSPGQFTPKDAFVLHPYGRYCNANHFAGEIDTLEALEHVRRHYPIDRNRIAVRGFSMGGAACWNFAVHYAGRWAAAAPGAGFSETPEFLRVFQHETLHPTDYEKKLLHLYDCTDWAINLYQCPVVAYSGTKDSQKQAADMMARALAEEGISLVHVLGQGAGHWYTPQARRQIDDRIDRIVARGRREVPARIRFTTWTLRYNRMLWVTVDRLAQHWQRARVDAEILGPSAVRVTTTNVTALTLSMPAGLCPLDNTHRPTVMLDGVQLNAAPVLSDRSWQAHFRKINGRWVVVPSTDDKGLAKRHGLQGPIDDAFMDSFAIVRPTGTAAHDKVARWINAELAHAREQWRRQFRGEAPVVDDVNVSDADMASRNLVLWGDPSSNKVLARLAGKLPIAWDARSVIVGGQHFDASHHVPVLIYPNPLNPRRYVVVNSGFTYREYDYLNNARQVPKLPDYAILDIDVPPSAVRPGGIVAAGFFDEHWQLPGKTQ